MLPWLYIVATIIAGLGFYWLRSNHRAWYGLSEILVALGLMYVIYFPHGGGGVLTGGGVAPSFLDTVAVQAVPVFVTVYAFVRGCDNLIGGLREPEH
jgi:hypothetical protein